MPCTACRRTFRTVVADTTALACGGVLLLLLGGVPQPAAADIVTGKVTPANAKVTILNAAGEKVAELKPGPYQIQLPVGKYTARCVAPAERTQDVLVLSEPVTVNIDCG